MRAILTREVTRNTIEDKSGPDDICYSEDTRKIIRFMGIKIYQSDTHYKCDPVEMKKGMGFKK